MSSTVWIDWEEEWAYWVNPTTLRMPRLRGRVPVGAVVLIKTQDRAPNSDRIVVSTYYGLATTEGPDDLPGKREATAILCSQAVAYMQEHKAYPPRVEIKKSFKNGNVDLSYQPADYDTFTLRITPGLLNGEQPSDFLAALAPHVDPEEPALPAAASPPRSPEPWSVERAKSGRATCRGCREKIDKDELRLGQPSIYEGRTGYRWYHVPCGAEQLIGGPEQLVGYESLPAPAQAQLLELLAN